MIRTLASPFARQREATSSYSHYHSGMQEHAQISDVKVYEKTPRTLHAQLNTERDFESVAARGLFTSRCLIQPSVEYRSSMNLLINVK